MLLEIATLPTVRSFAHSYQPEELGWDDAAVQLVAPVKVQGEVRRRREAEILVRGRLETEIKLECDRCLQPFAQQVATDFEAVYISSETYQQSTGENLAAEDLSVSVYDGATLDLAALFREEILLSVPVQTLCRADCAGLCPQCGAHRKTTVCACAERPTDPRWDALKKLNS